MNTENQKQPVFFGSPDELWKTLLSHAESLSEKEPALAPYLNKVILSQSGFKASLAHLLAHELSDHSLYINDLIKIMLDFLDHNSQDVDAATLDLAAICERDPAAPNPFVPYLFFKGFHALQSYRLAHALWRDGRQGLAFSIQGRMARKFSVDIHPAACLGHGIMFDHANGIVIGETAVVENNVSFLHSVTLGGTGKECGDRHPKIRSGVMIGAGAKVLGNIEIGSCARIAAGSVVLEPVPPRVTVAGVPARIVGQSGCSQPSVSMNQLLTPSSHPEKIDFPL